VKLLFDSNAIYNVEQYTTNSLKFVSVVMGLYQCIAYVKIHF